MLIQQDWIWPWLEKRLREEESHSEKRKGGGCLLGGNFNPAADAVLAVTALGTLGYATYELFQNSNTADDASASEGLIKHMDKHIARVNSICPTGNPDPNDPGQDPIKGWIKEVKAAIKNLQQKVNRMPKNSSKRQRLMDAINRGNNALKQWGE
jgi:hypothetical protein